MKSYKFKTMKKIITLLFILSFLNSKSQTTGNESQSINGLKFSKAIFLGYESNRTKDFISFSKSIEVPKGTVWCITSAKAFMLKGDSDPFENDISLRINGFIVDFYKSQFNNPLWLPEGIYKIELWSKDANNNIRFQAYISGIEYSIIK